MRAWLAGSLRSRFANVRADYFEGKMGDIDLLSPMSQVGGRKREDFLKRRARESSKDSLGSAYVGCENFNVFWL